MAPDFEARRIRGLTVVSDKTSWTVAPVVQRIERSITNRLVPGSNPGGGTKCGCGGTVYTADFRSATSSDVYGFNSRHPHTQFVVLEKVMI